MKNKLFVVGVIAFMLFSVAGCTPGSVIQINTPVPNTQASPPAPNGQINVPGVSFQIYIPGPNPLVNSSDARGHVAGILLGIWHGVISPVTLVWSFINPDVQMYEVHNNGSQYNLGFLIGMALVFIIIGALLGSGRR
ncbi:MAG TPA: hypothetical protein VF359_01445 [Anaerolineales bacterium]|jgi:hypothetical protein